MPKKKASPKPPCPSVVEDPVDDYFAKQRAEAERRRLAFSEIRPEFEKLVDVCHDHQRTLQRYQNDLPALCSDLRMLNDVLTLMLGLAHHQLGLSSAEEKYQILGNVVDVVHGLRFAVDMVKIQTPVPFDGASLIANVAPIQRLLQQREDCQYPDGDEEAHQRECHEDEIVEKGGVSFTREIEKLEELPTLLKSLPGGGQSGNDKEAIHSEDYRCVRWYGQVHDFTTTQAGVVKRLWEAWEAGIPIVSGEALCDASGGDSDSVRGIFRRKGKEKHPAWETMIMKTGKNSFFLQPPPADQNPT